MLFLKYSIFSSKLHNQFAHFIVDLFIFGRQKCHKYWSKLALIFFYICVYSVSVKKMCASVTQTFKNISIYRFSWIVEILFLWGLDKMNSKYELDRLVFKLMLKPVEGFVFQVSYKFAYKSKV
jgi:hypothetical protein